MLLKPAAFACSLDFAAGGEKKAWMKIHSFFRTSVVVAEKSIARHFRSLTHLAFPPSPQLSFFGNPAIKTPAVACLGGIRVTTNTTHTHNTKGRREREGEKTKPSIISTFTRKKKKVAKPGVGR